MAAAGAVGGRMVPVVMIDTAPRAEVAELIRLHEFLGVGDCSSQWGSNGPNNLLLYLEFQRPVVVDVVLRFEMPTKAFLVDQTLFARAIYLQHGVTGDSMKTTWNNPRVLIELPSTGFEEDWESIYPRQLQRILRDQGMARGPAKAAAAHQVGESRRLREVRLSRSAEEAQALIGGEIESSTCRESDTRSGTVQRSRSTDTWP